MKSTVVKKGIANKNTKLHFFQFPETAKLREKKKIQFSREHKPTPINPRMKTSEKRHKEFLLRQEGIPIKCQIENESTLYTGKINPTVKGKYAMISFQKDSCTFTLIPDSFVFHRDPPPRNYTSEQVDEFMKKGKSKFSIPIQKGNRNQDEDDQEDELESQKGNLVDNKEVYRDIFFDENDFEEDTKKGTKKATKSDNPEKSENFDEDSDSNYNSILHDHVKKQKHKALMEEKMHAEFSDDGEEDKMGFSESSFSSSDEIFDRKKGEKNVKNKKKQITKDGKDLKDQIKKFDNPNQPTESSEETESSDLSDSESDSPDEDSGIQNTNQKNINQNPENLNWQKIKEANSQDANSRKRRINNPVQDEEKLRDLKQNQFSVPGDFGQILRNQIIDFLHKELGNGKKLPFKNLIELYRRQHGIITNEKKEIFKQLVQQLCMYDTTTNTLSLK